MGAASARPTISQREEMVAAMDAVGVDAAIIVSTFNLYRYDPSLDPHAARPAECALPESATA